MCDVATAITVGISALGAVAESKAEQNAAKYNAAVANNNAILAERQRNDSIERGKEEELNFRRQLNQLKGSQRANYGASGVSFASGSPSDVLVDTAVLGEIDALTVRDNAAREAYGFDVQKQNYLSEAQFQRNKAKTSRQLLPFKIGTTIASNSKFQGMFSKNTLPWQKPGNVKPGGGYY